MGKSGMVSLDQAVIARLESHGKKFEILVDPDKALLVKQGKDVAVEDLVVRAEVYEDSRKGERPSPSDITKVFGTSDFKTIAYHIIKKGEVQLTTGQRHRMREEKTKQVANLIARRAYDPKSGTPHPVLRIQNAMEQAKIHINEMEPAELQIEKTIEAIRKILPISMETIQIAVSVPAAHAGKAYGKIKEFGHVRKEEWKNDGSWVAVIEIPGGMQSEFYALLNNMTHGEGEAKLLTK